MKRIAIFNMVVAFLAASLLTPPDVISQIVLGLEAAGACGLLMLILTRFASFEHVPNDMQKFMFGLICVLSIIAVHWCNLMVFR